MGYVVGSQLPLRDCRVYIGTYTCRGGRGIYQACLDLNTGSLQLLQTVAETENPSYLAIHPGGRFLYCVNEVSPGQVSSFTIHDFTGELIPLNQQHSRGVHPCYLSLSPSGKYVLVANYTCGSTAVFPVLPNGALDSPTSSLRPEQPGGTSQPHPRCVLCSALWHVLIADWGLDKIIIQKLNPFAGSLSPHSNPQVEVKRGAGPSRLAFHPQKPFLYLLNELDSSLILFRWDPRMGTLEEGQTISILPRDYKGANSAADLQIHPSGRFLYTSVQGHDSIALCHIEKNTGRLTLKRHQPTQGQTPRGLVLDPTGTILLAANQNSDSIVSFKIDPAQGQLTPTGQNLTVPAPVCLKIR